MHLQRAHLNFACCCNERQIIYKRFLQFMAKLKQLDVADYLIQISYDIRQLYPSIPVQDTLNITHLELVNDKTLKDKTKWKPKQIIKSSCTRNQKNLMGIPDHAYLLQPMMKWIEANNWYHPPTVF